METLIFMAILSMAGMMTSQATLTKVHLKCVSAQDSGPVCADLAKSEKAPAQPVDMPE